MSNVATVAQDTLNKYWDRNLPVNPFAIAYNMGVGVFFDPTLPVSGYFGYDNDSSKNPLVLINPKESLVRQRFTVFHELGHYILGHGPSPRDPDCNYNINNYVSKERDANAFAAEMIMPSEAVHIYVNKGYSISEMARLFDVSEQAMCIRLERIGTLPPGPPLPKGLFFYPESKEDTMAMTTTEARRYMEEHGEFFYEMDVMGCVEKYGIEIEKICGNCRHWEGQNERLLISVPVYEMKRRVVKDVAPCRKAAADQGDAGECVTLMCKEGTCRHLEDLFEPSEEYLKELEEEVRDTQSLIETEKSLMGPL